MKCVNCGANLVIDNSRMLKFCPYCGQEIELHEEEPQNMASAISGIAKSLLSQRAEQQRFNRDHAAEIRAEKRQERIEEQKNGFKIVFMMMGGMMVLGVIGMFAMRFMA